ncbi:flagellar assembly protein T N-terminal domain-containing protein [Candidatus Ponderosibacter sp. Uisw_141_02]|uniref:flagellar assembly protein T N-terminal domain-containing protein n=1 Tax=Candidatus Ponderosibacter sp. Uisw_141_02 TaxID=3231000 RepID=UPI003D4BA789
MPSRFITWLFATIFALLTGTHALAGDGLRMVTATGRAVINDQAAQHEAKNIALEDALYLAALRGGAKINGFSSVQADTSLDDHFVVRPSSEILDYRIINEVKDDLHYEVTVEAAVGKIAEPACHDRPVAHLTMFAPTMSMARSVPGWLSTMPSMMMVDLYRQLENTANLTLYNEAATVLDPVKIKRDARYDYNALVNGKASIRDGDFAFATNITLESFTTDFKVGQSQHLRAIVTTSLYAGSQLKPLGEVHDEIKLKLGERSPSLIISKLSTTKRDEVKAALLNGLQSHAKAIATATLCLPLKAEIKLENNKLRVALGMRQGIQVNRLAMVSGVGSKWSVLRVIDAGDGYSFLEPLSRQRKPADLNGKLATFLEMN